MKAFKFLILMGLVFLSSLNSMVLAQDTESEATDTWHSESLTNGFWGLNDQLAPSGIEVGLGLTSLYQANVHGGLSTNNRRGRYVGRYDLELSADLEKLLNIRGGSFFIHGWGGWSDAEGIDGDSVGSAWGIDALSVGDRSMDIVEFFYEGPLVTNDLTIAIGKLDFTGIFDANEYADDECSQFLNASFVDDPTIPFSEHGLGIVLNWDITDSWYLMGGIADAQADSRETGFRTTFHDEDYFFYAVETGKTIEFDSANGLMPGTYRLGTWIDSQDKENLSNTQTRRNDAGLYLSCDQMLYKENDDFDDSQGLGGFFRYGWADSKYSSVTNFFSCGFQYQGIFDGRDNDIMAVGYSKGFFSDNDSTNFPQDYESALEAYYNFQISPWFIVSPSIQYVTNPTDGAGTKTSDALLTALRLAVTF